MSAPEIEALTIGALKGPLEVNAYADTRDSQSDRNLIERHIEKVITSGTSIKIMLATTIKNTEPKDDEANDEFSHDGNDDEPEVLIIPWTP